MKKTFKVGDHVAWNSEAGRASGIIIKVHTKDVDYKGYMKSRATKPTTSPCTRARRYEEWEE